MAQVGLLEDNTLIAGMCVTLLRINGHRVSVYPVPELCLNALFPDEMAGNGATERVELPIDVLILDLGLPQVDGVDILRCLMAHPRTRSLPVILFTAAGHQEVLRAMEIAPHAGIVEKPFKVQTLVSAIDKALNTVPVSSGARRTANRE